MKRALLYFMLVACFMFISDQTKAQLRLTVEGTQFVSNFMYSNSAGEQDKDYKFKLTGAYRVGYQIRFGKGFYFRNTVGVRESGATLIYHNVNNDWSLQYVDVQMGIGYLFETESVDLYLAASGYNAHVMRANQRLNNLNYDLVDLNEFKTNEFGVFFQGGFNVDLSPQLDLNIGVNYLRGLSNLETSDDAQSTFNTAMGFDLGIAFKID